MKSSRISLGILGILNSKLQDSFSTNLTNFCDFNSYFVNGNIFFFSKLIIFLACLLKEVQKCFLFVFHVI